MSWPLSNSDYDPFYLHCLCDLSTQLFTGRFPWYLQFFKGLSNKFWARVMVMVVDIPCANTCDNDVLVITNIYA